MSPEPKEQPLRADATRPEKAVRVVKAEELLQGEKTLAIEFRGERYVLRTTRNDKLILTK